MKQKGVYLFLIVAFLFCSVLIIAQTAQETQSGEIDKAYTCFENELKDNCGGTKSTKQNAFNLLASAYDSSLQSDCRQALKEKLKTDCWGETETGSCNIKSTALATLALDYVGEDTDKYQDWLLTKKIKDTGLTWFLEIDANNKTACTINGATITLEDDKKISGNPPQGLVKAYNNYWFEIKDLEKNYSISCDKDFVTALVYQKPGSSVYHISSQTQTASQFDTLTEKVNAYCFGTANICDYEGTLWATLTLAKIGEDTTPFLPYIVSMADKTDHKQYLPAAFIYILTTSDDYYDELISAQKSNSYWDESRNKFYDTALALFALSDLASDNGDRAKRYLISTQNTNGCWSSDTAFILHAVWPKTSVASSGGGSSLSYCGDFGYFCTALGDCQTTDKLDNFYCASSAQACCKVKPVQPTCAEKSGVICEVEQVCSGSDIPASDTTACCVGDCIFADVQPECELQGYACRLSCGDGQEEKVSYSSSCGFGDVCCATLPQESGSSFWIIVLLIILIILVVLAIVFRNQIKVWWIKRNDKRNQKKDVLPSPAPLPTRFVPPRFQNTFTRPQAGRKVGRDSEFDETMRKLREMSK